MTRPRSPAGGRTRECDEHQLRGRLQKALEFERSARLISDGAGVPGELADPFVTLAVHAGIAAADVICCRQLHRHAMGESHVEAVGLLRSVGRDGRELARSLETLLGLKTKAAYTAQPVTAAERKSAERALARLMDAARLAASPSPP